MCCMHPSRTLRNPRGVRSGGALQHHITRSEVEDCSKYSRIFLRSECLVATGEGFWQSHMQSQMSRHALCRSSEPKSKLRTLAAPDELACCRGNLAKHVSTGV
jgi:hypothetical protein